jgi:hypothetical protein
MMATNVHKIFDIPYIPMKCQAKFIGERPQWLLNGATFFFAGTKAFTLATDIIAE